MSDQIAFGWEQYRRYRDSHPDDLMSVRAISLLLGIRLQHVKQIPVVRVEIKKLAYYRKGDIDRWVELDLAQPNSLLKQLREQHRQALLKQGRQPSTRYKRKGEGLSATEAKEAKDRTIENVKKEPDRYEAWAYPGSVRVAAKHTRTKWKRQKA